MFGDIMKPIAEAAAESRKANGEIVELLESINRTLIHIENELRRRAENKNEGEKNNG